MTIVIICAFIVLLVAVFKLYSELRYYRRQYLDANKMNDNVKRIKESITIREIVIACENINRTPGGAGIFKNYNSIIDYISDCIRSLHSQFDNFIDIQLIGIEEIKMILGYSLAKVIVTLIHISVLADVDIDGEIKQIMKKSKEDTNE